MEQNQIKFGIELPKELHRQVKIAVATRGLKMKDASEQAFTSWLASAGEGKQSHKAAGAAQVEAASPFGGLSPEEEQYVEWLLALVRQKKPTPSAEIALQAVRLAGTEAIGEKPVAGRKKQKVG
ncbi:MAG: hypothetical protein M1482_11105 [Chloroflexi bacterium]|nr:hypothetical protein [Chloroflexota bacterium]